MTLRKPPRSHAPCRVTMPLTRRALWVWAWIAGMAGADALGNFAVVHAQATYLPYDGGSPSAMTPAAPPRRARVRHVEAPPAALGAEGEVLKAGDLTAIISLGAHAGLALGDRVLFVEDTPLPVDVWSNALPAKLVGRVVALGDARARVALGMFESARVGQRVQVTSERASEPRKAPPRPAAAVILEAGFRPFMPLPRVSVGALAELAVTYVPRLPMFVRAELSPSGGRLGAGPDLGTWAGLASVGYDHRYGALGLGLGAVLQRDYIDLPEAGDRGQLAGPVARLQFAQILRIGARDGVHLLAKPALALSGDRWSLASLTMAGQLPLSTRAALAPRVVLAPQSGFLLAELGMRVLVCGNGSSGSLFVRPVAGVVGTFDQRNNRARYADSNLAAASRNLLFGPMAGVDLEWRL